MRSQNPPAKGLFPTVVLMLAGAAGGLHAAPDVQHMLGAGTIGPEPVGDGYEGALVQVGDFNNDGFRDLLYHDQNNQQLVAMMGDASGGYTQYGPIELPIGTSSLVAAQLDDDSEPEMVVRNPVWGFTYSPGIDESPVENNDPNIDYTIFGSSGDAFAPLVRAGDLDGDGKDELIFNTSDDEVYIRWSGDASIVAVQVNGLGEQNTVYEPADFDGDGDVDVLLFSQDTQRFILIEGTGSTAIGVVREIMRDYPSIADEERPVFGQFDSNPAMDMVVVDIAAQSFRTESNFVLNSVSVKEIGIGEYPLPLHIAGDLDGSGEPDLIVYRFNQYGIYSGRPDFYPAIVYDFATKSPSVGDDIVGQPRRSFPYVDSLLTDFPKPVVTTFDADQDQDEDIIWYGYNGAQANNAWFIENRSGVEGVPQFGMDSIEIVDGPLFVTGLDIDDDGYDEYIIPGSTNMRVLDMQDGTLGRVVASNDAFMVAAADLDGDGTPELVNGWTGTSNLRIFTKNADNSYGNRILCCDSLDYDPFLGIEAADFNNDGLDDIVATISNDVSVVLLGGVGPSLSFLAELAPLEPSGNKPGVLDYDGDGLMDVALGGDEITGVELFRNEGDGTFSRGPIVPIDLDSGFANPYWVTTGDVDLDGSTDIVVTDNIRFVAVLFLDGGGNLEESRYIQVWNPVEAVIADFNQDGLPDIGIAGTDQSGIESSAAVVPQIAPRAFGRPIALPAFGVQGVTASDVNLDGIPDMVAVSDTERMLRTFLGSPAAANPCPADLNGDGELNFFDVSFFLVNQTDYNSDGEFNFFDVAAFIADYQTGCP